MEKNGEGRYKKHCENGAKNETKLEEKALRKQPNNS
jgi:hypothetical protein